MWYGCVCGVHRGQLAGKTGVSVGRLRETSEQPHACDTPVGHRRPIRQNSDSSNVIAQKQDQCKRSKCMTSQRCLFCPKEFNHVSDLRKHERVHTGDRPFKRDVCGMSFPQAGNLCAYKRTHTGERPHKCETCGTSFLHSSNLRRHERIHSGERPFKCQTCVRSFTRSNYLRDHKRIHTRERPCRCEEWAKVFRTSSSLCGHKCDHNLNEESKTR